MNQDDMKSWFEADATNDVTVVQFNEFIAEWVEQREVLTEQEREAKAAKAKLTVMEEKLKEFFTLLGYDSCKTPIGSVTLVKKVRYNSPSGENKDRLFDYLKQSYPESWESNLSYNANSLQTFIRGEQEKHGEEFVVPGCDAHYDQEYFQFRGKK